MSPEEWRNEPRQPQAPPGVPVTVSITRTVDPQRITEVTHWVQAGVNLANRYPGFLGSGWVRSSQDSESWHMLYRFGSQDTLDAWETSPDRLGWLETGRDLVSESRVEKRTGIEGWFDSPESALGEPAASVAPPRWKQASSIWLGFFPVNLVFTLLVTAFVPGWNDLPTALKVLITTSVLTPIMAYWVLPGVTRLLRPWLQRRR
ncbi:antibiotic biosynthesis monooxygenase (ABM) superfamily enzyme [Conyzicola lurida]|uniref:Antibiotic biosynthesis monooxygenase (ABM) superfamily enzyme n=1 Tax=Conyzicola lurida TaxID=1172621 RepID=A0A841ANC9_9MICO|nr:antibiotic biosynthesis monooxygenase [Conyzicola lurida]MBB5843216.1 antibiotic biosynthesis monooxygenase (ABM) superfamily enzyme [Conyzicola lurida]